MLREIQKALQVVAFVLPWERFRSALSFIVITTNNEVSRPAKLISLPQTKRKVISLSPPLHPPTRSETNVVCCLFINIRELLNARIVILKRTVIEMFDPWLFAYSKIVGDVYD